MQIFENDLFEIKNSDDEVSAIDNKKDVYRILYIQYCGQFSENSTLMPQGLCHKG